MLRLTTNQVKRHVITPQTSSCCCHTLLHLHCIPRVPFLPLMFLMPSGQFLQSIAPKSSSNDCATSKPQRLSTNHAAIVMLALRWHWAGVVKACQWRNVSSKQTCLWTWVAQVGCLGVQTWAASVLNGLHLWAAQMSADHCSLNQASLLS